MFKRFISLSICFMIFSSVLVGCGNASNTNPTASAVKKDPVTISFWFPGSDKVNDDYFTNIAKEFENVNPYIKVEVTVLPSMSADIDTKLNAAQLSGIYPDVMSAYLAAISNRGSRGEFYNLNDLVGKWSETNDIYESTINMGKLKDQILGLGFFPAPEILVYRKDFFKEAGLDQEKPPKTWEELEDYAKKLIKVDATGNITRAGFDIPATNAGVFYRTFLRQGGSVIVDEKNQVPAFTDQNSIDTFDFLKKLYNDKVSIPYDYQKKDSIPFVKGNSAMSYLPTTSIASMIKQDPSIKDKLGYVPVLEKKNKVDFCGYRLFTIGAKSKYVDASWEFVKFMMSKDQMMKRAKDMNMPPVRKSLEKDFIALDSVLNTAVVDYVKYGKGAEAVPWGALLLKYLDVAFQETYLNKKTSEQALKDAYTALKKDLDSSIK